MRLYYNPLSYKLFFYIRSQLWAEFSNHSALMHSAPKTKISYQDFYVGFSGDFLHFINQIYMIFLIVPSKSFNHEVFK